MSEEIRVLIADDHRVVRAGIRLLLEQTPDITVVAEAGDGKEALRLHEKFRPHVLLLDVEMPNGSGIEVAQQLKGTDAPAKILVLSAHNDSAYVSRLVESGAAGYLLKEEAPGYVVDAVRRVAAGESGVFSPGVPEILEDPWMAGLTDAEMAVVRLVVEGMTNRAIAAELGITEKAVEKRLENVFKKWGVNSRTEVAVFAVREHLV